MALMVLVHDIGCVCFDFAAMERNNLMRLAHTIPFTPVSLLGELHYTVYTLICVFTLCSNHVTVVFFSIGLASGLEF